MKYRHRAFKHAVGLLFALGIMASQPASAALLGLTPHFPDLSISNSGSGLSFVYDFECAVDCGANQGKLTLSKVETSTGSFGSYTERTEPGDFTNAAFGGPAEFSLTVILDTSGNVLSGSFFITGTIREPFPQVLYDGSHDPSGQGYLLSGDITEFGWEGNGAPSSGGVIDLTFGNANGVIAKGVKNHPTIPDGELLLRGPVNYNGGGMIFSINDSTLGEGNFSALALTQDWNSLTGGSGDVFVPVPAAVWLFGSGLLALAGLSRRPRRASGRKSA